jgi:hypothetical protein
MGTEIKKARLPEKKLGGIVTNLMIDGKEKRVMVWHGEVIEGCDSSGIRLQITRPEDIEQAPFIRFKWRLYKGSEEGDWSPWFFTAFSPTERINDLDNKAPTIAQVFEAVGGRRRERLPYGALWKLYGPSVK